MSDIKALEAETARYSTYMSYSAGCFIFNVARKSFQEWKQWTESDEYKANQEEARKWREANEEDCECGDDS